MNKAELKKHLSAGERTFAISGNSSFDRWSAVKAEVVEIDVEMQVYSGKKKAIKIKIVEESSAYCGVSDIFGRSLGHGQGIGRKTTLAVGEEFFIGARYISEPWSTYAPRLEAHNNAKREQAEALTKALDVAAELEVRLYKLGFVNEGEGMIYSINRRTGTFSFRAAHLRAVLDKVAEQS